jgi:hypothetical protein
MKWLLLIILLLILACGKEQASSPPMQITVTEYVELQESVVKAEKELKDCKQKGKKHDD